MMDSMGRARLERAGVRLLVIVHGVQLMRPGLQKAGHSGRWGEGELLHSVLGHAVVLAASEEREMITGVLRLGDRAVRGVMTPRTDVHWSGPADYDELFSVQALHLAPDAAVA